MGLFSWFQKDDETIQKEQCYHIEGFLSCAYFSTAVEAGDRLTSKYPNVKVKVNSYIKDQWADRARELQKEFNTTHRTSPFIYEGCHSKRMVGGYTDFAKMIKSVYKMNVPSD